MRGRVGDSRKSFSVGRALKASSAPRNGVGRGGREGREARRKERGEWGTEMEV
jgi:hypothetical protein